MIPESFIADLLNRVDITDVVGRVVPLKKGGANLVGLCPFHNEKSPSFTVSPTKQFYHCFGCGAHGTAIGFLMEHSGMSFPEAVRDLAQGAGMTMPQEDNAPSNVQRAESRAVSVALTETLAKAALFYKQQLRGSRRAIDYLKGRGLSGEIAARFGLGYAPDRWDALKGAFADYEASELVGAGLVIAKEASDAGDARRYDRFRDRVMFPIRSQRGDVIGFGGRILDQGEPKYLNSPETPVFQKGNELYGLFEARQAIRERGFALVVEGYMDVVALAQLGFPNAVATLGTACTATHVVKLLRQTDHIVFSFDGDAAGRRAAWRALEASLPHAADDKLFSFLFLPPEHDPDTFIRAFGAQGFEREVSSAVPLSRFLVDELSQRCDLATAEGRAKLIHDAAPLLRALPDGMLRLQLLDAVAGAAQTGVEAVARAAEVRLSSATQIARRRDGAPARATRASIAPLQLRILRLLVAEPKAFFTLDESLATVLCEDAGVLGDFAQALRRGGATIGYASLEARLENSPHISIYRRLAAEAMAPAAMTGLPALATADEVLAELVPAARRLQLGRVKDEADALALHGSADAAARERFRVLEAMRAEIQRRLNDGS